MNVITKRPKSHNLERKSLSFQGYEVASLLDYDNPSEIHVFNENDELQAVIPHSEFKHLVFDAKAGWSGAYILANYELCETLDQPKRSLRFYKAKAKRASNSDPVFSFTYRVNDLRKTGLFADELLVDGEQYQFEYSNGSIITLKVSRRGQTLYTGSLDGDYGLHIPQAAGVVRDHKVVRVTHVE